MPTARWDPAVAVVNGILYEIGGNSTLSGPTDVVEAYDPSSDTWSTKAPMPIANAPVAKCVHSRADQGHARLANQMMTPSAETLRQLAEPFAATQNGLPATCTNHG